MHAAPAEDRQGMEGELPLPDLRERSSRQGDGSLECQLSSSEGDATDDSWHRDDDRGAHERDDEQGRAVAAEEHVELAGREGAEQPAVGGMPDERGREDQEEAGEELGAAHAAITSKRGATRYSGNSQPSGGRWRSKRHECGEAAALYGARWE